METCADYLCDEPVQEEELRYQGLCYFHARECALDDTREAAWERENWR